MDLSKLNQVAGQHELMRKAQELMKQAKERATHSKSLDPGKYGLDESPFKYVADYPLPDIDQVGPEDPLYKFMAANKDLLDPNGEFRETRPAMPGYDHEEDQLQKAAEKGWNRAVIARQKMRDPKYVPETE